MENENKKRYPKLYVSIIALVLDFAAVPLFFIGGFFLIIGWSIIFPLLGFLIMLVGICCPFGAIATGIASLCLGKQKTGTAGTVMAVAAIVIPVVAVIVTVILFSTGVARISLM